jgi:hypothetical protein
MPLPVHSIKFWINAFVPAFIPGITVPVPGRGGETMVPGPPELGFSGGAGAGLGKYSLTPLARAPYGFQTDGRVFSSDPKASSRMHSEVKVDTATGQQTVTQHHECGRTLVYSQTDGSILRSGFTDNRRMGFVVSKDIPGFVGLRMSCASSNPCVPASTRITDIEYSGDLEIDFAKRSILIKLFLDDFPAFEAYAAINDGPGVELFRRMPEKGTEVSALVGFAGIAAEASRKEHRQLVDTDDDAVFDRLTTLK